MYQLILIEDNRITGWYCPPIDPAGIIPADKPPENYYDYLYVNGEYIYDPLPEPESEPELSVWDELDGAFQAGYDEGYSEGVNSI